MNASRILGTLCALAILAIAIALGGSGDVFYSSATLILTVGVPLYLVLATFGARDCIRLGVVLRALIVSMDPEDVRPRDLARLRSLIHYTYASAGVAMLLGLVNMLANLEDPSVIGAGMAISMLAPLYALIMVEIGFRPCLRRLEALNPEAAASCAGDSPQPALTEVPGPFAALGLAFFVIVNFLILLLSFSTLAPVP